VVNSGLVDESNFAPVDLKSYKSMVDSNIHIVGDSHKSTQQKQDILQCGGLKILWQDANF